MCTSHKLSEESGKNLPMYTLQTAYQKYYSQVIVNFWHVFHVHIKGQISGIANNFKKKLSKQKRYGSRTPAYISQNVSNDLNFQIIVKVTWAEL
jgi:hypothetical protein